ncbi:MAG: maltose/maltodextrin transport permease-like protein [Chlorobiaceae bacterium]|nr:maltose/maltodextrin transport permease-like protein [Chlorobiaceae bacterium]MBA4310761.1 maltose/maltodextrin transport permease-like protein [Chlorobiaceae bacterium]
MKKYLHLFLSLFALLIFSSCAREKDPNQIVIWHTMRPEETQLLQTQIDRFTKLHPDIKVQQLYKETELMRSGFIISAMAGQGPDLVYGPADQIGPFEEIEIIRPMNDLFTPETLSKFRKEALVYKNGRLLAVADKLGNHLTLVYNKDLVQTPPITDKELIALGQKLTKRNEKGQQQFGLVWNYTEPYFFIPFLTGFGGWVIDSLNRPTLDTESMRNALGFIQDLRDKYKIIPREADYEMADALFKEGRAAMMINGDWSWAGYQNAGMNIGIAPLPFITSTGLYASPTVAPKGYSVNINVTDEKLKKVKKLLDYLLTPENMIEVALATKTLPTRIETLEDPRLLNDPILINSKRQIDLGTPLPIVTEMRAIWDAMRPAYQSVLGGSITPEAATKEMQLTAERKIRELREEIVNPLWGLIVQIMMFLVVITMLIMMRKSIMNFFKYFKRDSFAYLFALPAIVVMIAVIAYPFFYNIVLSFSNMSLAHLRDWSIVGFVQYAKVFSEPQFYEIFLKTIIWTAVNVFFHVTIGVTLALLLNKKLPGSKIFQVILILPWAIPQYIVALTWRGMFNFEYGSINLLLTNVLSLPPVEWLKSPLEAFIAVIITNIWLGFPFMMIIALGALQSIPKELYEAADIDGAKWYQKLKNITIPLIKPVMIPAITLGTIWTFNNINVVWLVSNAGEPADQTHILVSYVYKAAFNLYRYGYAAAFSVVIFLILLIANLTFLRKTKATESVYS